MNQPQAKSAKSVQDTLDRAGLACKVLELPSSTRTAADAAASIGCTIQQIAKALSFKTKKTAKPVLVLASGPNRVSEQNIERHLSESIIKADADFTRQVTGFAIGGIPPIGHKEKIDFIFMDQDLLQLEIVWAAAGTPNAVFSIQSKDLLSITKAKVIAIY